MEKILLYSAGQRFKSLFGHNQNWTGFLRERGYEIIGVADKKLSKDGADLFGLKMIDLSTDKEYKIDQVVVLSNKYFSQIKNELDAKYDYVISWDDFILKVVSETIKAELFKGLNGVEVGGPSWVFQSIYSVCEKCDNVVFSLDTVWKKYTDNDFVYNNRKLGTVLCADAVDMSCISDNKYDFLICSNILEHVANPIKAVKEFVRITKQNGIIMIIVPGKEFTFDHKRPYTTFEHLLLDFDNNVSESDLTHLSEIEMLHDYQMDEGVSGKEEFVRRAQRNIDNRCLHHHVFSEDVLQKVSENAGIEIIDVFSIINDIGIIGRNCKK